MTQQGSPNQIALELIYAVKGLAQAVDNLHSDLRHLLETDARSRDAELDKIKDLLNENSKAISHLPVGVADRIERVVEKLEKNTDGRVNGVLNDVRVTLNEVRQKLWYHLKDQEQSAEETKSAVVRAITEHEKELTGKVEFTKDGDVRLHAKFDWKKLSTLLTVGKWTAIGGAGIGGLGWLLSKLRDLFG